MNARSEADHAALGEAKQVLRAAVQTRRTARAAESTAFHDHARCTRVREFLGTPGTDLVTAVYVSIPPEPGTLELISWLYAAGSTVLLPVLGRHPEGSPRREPDWAAYAGPESLRVGLWGIPEPTTEPLGPDGLTRAGVIVCAGLAGTPQGKRLGTGGGWFDRALAYADPNAVLVLLLNDDEVLSDLPTQPWDRRVDVIATPNRVIDATAR